MKETKTIEELRRAVDSANAAYDDALAAVQKAMTDAQLAFANSNAAYAALAAAIRIGTVKETSMKQYETGEQEKAAAAWAVELESKDAAARRLAERRLLETEGLKAYAAWEKARPGVEAGVAWAMWRKAEQQMGAFSWGFVGRGR